MQKRIKPEATKRITLDIDSNIDKIREQLKKDSGVDFTYIQTFNFLVAFYMRHANEPRTKWSPLA